jgi:hypothetical protein
MDSTGILQLEPNVQAEQVRDIWRDKAYRSLFYFAKVIMGYKELVGYLHGYGCDEIQNTALTIRKRGILWPRGHFKSTMGKAYALWCLLPKLEVDPWGNPYPEDIRYCHDPNKRILYVSESAIVAAKNLKDIKWAIENNEILKWLFPEIIPANFNATKWTDEEILLPRSKSYDESSITTKGVGGKGTGFHYDLIIYDDIVGEEASHSTPVMEDAINWFRAAPGLMNDQETAEELILGTRWKDGAADLYGWIMENIPDQYIWSIKSCYDDAGLPIFPDRFSKLKLDDIRRREGEYLFACNYLNDPTNKEGADFKPEWIRWYKVGEDGKTLYPEDGSAPVALSSLNRISFYDIAKGGKKSKAESALGGSGMASDGRLFVLDAWAENATAGEVSEVWHQMHDRFIFQKNYFEDFGVQSVVCEVVKLQEAESECARCKARGKSNVHHRHIRPEGWKPPGGNAQPNKEERIRLYSQKQFEGPGVYLRRGPKGMEKLKKQILAFPHMTQMDLIDMLAYLCKLSRRPLSDEYVAEEKEREEKILAQRETRSYTERNYGGYV